MTNSRHHKSSLPATHWLTLIPIFALLVFGVLIVVFAIWRTPTVAANIKEVWLDSRIDRSLAKEGAIVLTVVYAIGTLMFAVGLRLHWWFRQLTKLMTEFPGQPWMYRRDWREGRIVLSNRSAIIVAAAGTLFLAFVVIPLFRVLSSNAPFLKIVSAAFVIFWLLFVRILWINRHWNQSILELRTLPGRIGGTFEAVALIPARKPLPTTVKAKLTCLQYSKRPSGLSNTIWVSAQTLPVTLSPATEFQGDRSVSEEQIIRVPLIFEIPANGPLPFNRRRRIFWQLTVSPSEPGTLLEAWFEVPVY